MFEWRGRMANAERFNWNSTGFLVCSLRTADAFPVVASLPPKNSYFRRERSDERKCVCCSQARLCLLLGLNFGKNSQSQKMFNLQRESSRNVTCCTAVREDNRSLCLQALDIYGKFAPLMIHGCFHLAGFGKRC